MNKEDITLDFEFKERYNIEDLRLIMRLLRGENGCKWDMAQTHESIRKNFIEETYEVCEAIDNKDKDLLQEELGDVLLQVVFHSQMEEEVGSFTFDDVVNGICQKLIVRHPHIFSDVKVSSVDDILNNWSEIKKKTKGQETVSDTLKSVPKQLPALMRCDKIISRAEKSGKGVLENAFDFDMQKYADEIEDGPVDERKDNIAKLIFTVVKIARDNDLDAEEILSHYCDQFISDFEGKENK